MIGSLPLCDSIDAYEFAYFSLDVKALSLQNEDRALKYSMIQLHWLKVG